MSDMELVCITKHVKVLHNKIYSTNCLTITVYPQCGINRVEPIYIEWVKNSIECIF